MLDKARIPVEIRTQFMAKLSHGLVEAGFPIDTATLLVGQALDTSEKMCSLMLEAGRDRQRDGNPGIEAAQLVTLIGAISRLHIDVLLDDLNESLAGAGIEVNPRAVAVGSSDGGETLQ